MKFSDIYKRDSNGNVRVWFMELEGDRYRTSSGILKGALVTSDWTVAVPASQPTAELQAEFEVGAAYRHKLSREYHERAADIDSARFFKPMLAHKFEGWTGPGFAQPKLDGVRCIVTEDGMFSREGKPILGAPHIRKALDAFFTSWPDAIFDGELYNHDLKDDFNTIVSAVKKQNPTPAQLEKSAELVQYHVYDCPSVAENFEYRYDTLAQALEDYADCIKVVETIPVVSSAALDLLYGEWLEAGYEGQMFRLDKPYEQKRSKTLLKRKEFECAEFPISLIGEGTGNWAGHAKFVEFILPDDKRCADGTRPKAGIRGSKAFTKQLLAEAGEHKLATIRSFKATPDGIPRFAVATAFHGSERTL